MNVSFHKFANTAIYGFRNVSSDAMLTPLGLKYTNLDVFPPRYVIVVSYVFNHTKRLLFYVRSISQIIVFYMLTI